MDVPRGTRRLERLVELVVGENERQNLVGPGTVQDFELRHVVDSQQLVPLLRCGPSIDVGSGGGFPGLVLACERRDPIVLIEPRKLRAAFLADAIRTLDLAHASVFAGKVQNYRASPVASITARAVMALTDLFAAAIHLSDRDTRWVLPKGRSARSELATARRSWQGRFELVQSVTDPEAAIVVAEDVRRR